MASLRKGPSIGAVIPAYNAERTIGKAIESVLAQTHPLDEIIVVDDGSADRTAEIAARFPGAFVIRRPNGGPGAARNTGIQAAKSEWIAFLDSDDTWAHHKTERQLRCITPETGVIHCSPHDPVRFAELWHRKTYILPSGTLVRKATLLEVGGFDESRSIVSAEDLHLWLKIALTDWRFVRSEPTLLTYRPSASSLSGCDLRMAQAELACIDMIGTQVGCQSLELLKIKQACIFEYVSNLKAKGRFHEAVQLLRQADTSITQRGWSFVPPVYPQWAHTRRFVDHLWPMEASHEDDICSGVCLLPEARRKQCMHICGGLFYRRLHSAIPHG